MEKSIGIISEGVTDYTVLRGLLAEYYGNANIDTTPLQPVTAPSGKGSKGGWTRVFQFCGSERFRDAFDSPFGPDFVLIQLDTDVCQEKGFDVCRNQDGKDLLPEELAKCVQAKLIEVINKGAGRDNYFDEITHRVLFSIAVDCMECWLLPFFCETVQQSETTLECLGLLNVLLVKKGLKKIEPRRKRNERYVEIMRNKDLFEGPENKAKYTQNPSMKLFIEQELAKLPTTTTP